MAEFLGFGPFRKNLGARRHGICLDPCVDSCFCRKIQPCVVLQSRFQVSGAGSGNPFGALIPFMAGPQFWRLELIQAFVGWCIKSRGGFGVRLIEKKRAVGARGLGGDVQLGLSVSMCGLSLRVNDMFNNLHPNNVSPKAFEPKRALQTMFPACFRLLLGRLLPTGMHLLSARCLLSAPCRLWRLHDG